MVSFACRMFKSPGSPRFDQIVYLYTHRDSMSMSRSTGHCRIIEVPEPVPCRRPRFPAGSGSRCRPVPRDGSFRLIQPLILATPGPSRPRRARRRNPGREAPCRRGAPACCCSFAEAGRRPTVARQCVRQGPRPNRSFQRRWGARRVAALRTARPLRHHARHPAIPRPPRNAPGAEP